MFYEVREISAPSVPTTANHARRRRPKHQVMRNGLRGHDPRQPAIFFQANVGFSGGENNLHAGDSTEKLGSFMLGRKSGGQLK